MELSEIMDGFAGECAAGEAVAGEDGSYAFDIDETRVTFSATEDGAGLLTQAEVGLLPADGREKLFRTILESSGFDNVSFALEPGGDVLCLQRADDLDGLDLPQFTANLEAILDGVGHARALLAEYAETLPDEEAQTLQT